MMMADVTALTFQDPENHGHHIHHLLLLCSEVQYSPTAAVQCSAVQETERECSSRQQAI